MKLTYGGDRRIGSAAGHIAALYERQTPKNIVVTHGAIGGMRWCTKTLVEPG